MTNSVGLRSERGPILGSLMLSSGLVAMEATILATAVPSIVKDLGGFSQFPWLFSVFLLAQAVSVPVYSKLADVVGRKPIILFGIGVFLLGSVLGGFAWSMPALIAFRALQGVGSGAIQPIGMTIAGDIYTLAERAKIQAYLASVWAMSSVLGPTVGGLFSQFLSWRLIFFVNIPLCLVAGWMLFRNFHEKVQKRSHRIDYAGGIVLTCAMTLVILGLLEGGQAWAWNSWPSISVLAGGAVLLVAFVLIERRAAEPMLPLWIISRRLLRSTMLIGFAIGAIVIGLTSFIPTYLEGALAVQPLVAGFALAVLTLGWPLSAAQSGRLFLRLGFRPTALLGTAGVLLGAVALVLVVAFAPSLLMVALCCLVVGLGLGLCASPGIIAAQSSVPWDERGVVTGANMFSRAIGSAVGVAIFGAIANAIFAQYSAGESDPRALSAASLAVFIGIGVAALLTVVFALSMPKVRAHHLEPHAVDV